MNTRESGDQFSAVDILRQQNALLSQLFQVAVSMHYIDELFQWLAYAFVHRLNIQLLLFWTNHIGQAGQLTAQLRTTARQDPSLPEQIVINDQMQRVAQRFMSERLAYQPQPVDTLFSHYQMTLLKRYGLYYWGACFTSRDALLPPRATVFSQAEMPAFFAMTTMFFLRHIPQTNLIPAINTILEEAMSLAEKRGLLLPATQHPTAGYTSPSPSLTPPLPAQPQPFLQAQPQTPPVQPWPQTQSRRPMQAAAPSSSAQGAPFTLAQLIPCRKQDADLLLSSNPFARPAAISDKRARRLHAAIDGQLSVEELCAVTGFTMQEVIAALRILWDQRRIEMQEPAGKPVNLSHFLP
jgi:hypothetical protein